MKRISILFLQTILAIFSIIEISVEAKCSQSIIRLRRNYQNPTERFLVLLKPATPKRNKRLSSTFARHLRFMKECWGRVPLFIFDEDFPASGYYSQRKILVFSGGSIEGYSGLFDPLFVKEQLEPLPEIQIVERDTYVANFGIEADVIREHLNHDYDDSGDGDNSVGDDNTLNRNATTTTTQNTTTTTQNEPDHMSQLHLSLSRNSSFPISAGSGVNIYVLDTGVHTDHREFGDRARFGGTFCKGCEDFDDNGHGTHIAGIISGRKFGIARKSKIISVKVLDSYGVGYVSEVVTGMAFVLKEHLASKKKNTIVNMSFGSNYSKALNYAIKLLFDAGIHVVVAAGNEADDACNLSPASSSSAITVGAIESNENIKADFSNFGRCVDIFAPGVDVVSASSESDTGRVILSGTSQAVPHVTGTIALLISEFGNSSPLEMIERLINTSTKNAIKDLPYNTPNRLVFGV